MKTIVLGLLSLAALATQANAQNIYVEAEALRSARVNVAEVNLGTQAGRDLLQRRLRGAATTVCDNAGDRSLAAALASRSCTAAALADGDRQLSQLINPAPATSIGSF